MRCVHESQSPWALFPLHGTCAPQPSRHLQQTSCPVTAHPDWSPALQQLPPWLSQSHASLHHVGDSRPGEHPQTHCRTGDRLTQGGAPFVLHCSPHHRRLHQTSPPSCCSRCCLGRPRSVSTTQASLRTLEGGSLGRLPLDLCLSSQSRTSLLLQWLPGRQDSGAEGGHWVAAAATSHCPELPDWVSLPQARP